MAIRNISTAQHDFEFKFEVVDGPATAYCRIWSNPECRSEGDPTRIRIDSIIVAIDEDHEICIEVGGGPRSYISFGELSPIASMGCWSGTLKDAIEEKVCTLGNRLRGKPAVIEFGEATPDDDDYESGFWW